MKNTAAARLVLIANLAVGSVAMSGWRADADSGPTEWATKVWDAATQGQENRFYSLLAEGVDNDALSASVRESIVSFRANLDKREEKRRAKAEEVWKRLDENMAKGTGDAALSAALRDAVELELVIGRDALLADERIQRLIREAEAAARTAEARSDWLSGSELFGRLSVLFDQEKTYDKDVSRLVQRLGMIRLYDPHRLWQLRNERRLAEGETALPAYNPAADDFRQKLSGVDRRLVSYALLRSANLNVENKGLGEMIQGGLDALKTLATTTDLQGAFPGLADETAKARFLDRVDQERVRVEQAGAAADANLLSGVLSRLSRENQETVRVPEGAMLHEFGNGAMSRLDEYSQIIWPDELRRFERSTQGKFVGVGVQIQLDELSNIKIVTPLEGTPAQRAGIRPGDIIKKVNGASAIGFTLDQAVDVITGPKDTAVTLTVEREIEGEKKETDYQLTRAVIKLRSVKGWQRLDADEDHWDWFIDDASRVAYMRLTQFHEDTTREFDRALSQMRQMGGVGGVILDLRFNPGGLLDQAVSITSRFVDSTKAQATRGGGIVVSTHGARQNTGQRPERLEADRAALADVPVVVLVNESSASASEIVSGAVQDYARAGTLDGILIGQRSFGKGSVQNVWYVSDNPRAALKLTTQYYQLPGGRLIHHTPGRGDYGVEPNMEVEMLPEQMVEALRIRQDADTVPLDEKGRPVAMDKVPNPDTLLSEGWDLQLQAALVLLQSRLAAGTVGEPTALRPVVEGSRTP